MSKRLFFILSILIVWPVAMLAQYMEQSFVIYHGNGTSEAFVCETIDSITYSYYDLDNQLCDQVVTLIIHSPDATVPVSIANIDSIQILSLPSYCPDAHHPHAIDLGLSNGTLWACCNVGARAPEAYGSYFAWGEVEEKESYSKENYLYSYYDAAVGDYSYKNIGDDISGTEYDVAFAKWGAPWCMPSREDCQELIDSCQFQPVNYRGISGTLCTGPNGNSVFFPHAGWYSPAFHSEVASCWSSVPYRRSHDYFSPYAYFLQITPLGNICLTGMVYNDRYLGRSVRAVVGSR